ncbi:MAG: bifunctional UDP-sugar hydrolase/5'-nucleotidase [Eubacteriales bacterium]|nr:bifunctional UDP-sugar hydrolase/5'-nucleotidase [Eubacteriales bacterium]
MANGIKNGNFLRILFTADMHDRILPYKAVRDGKIQMIGGYARLKTMIDRYRTDSCVVVDGGDYSMGSLFNGIYSSSAPDLTLLGMMGYDAVTIGNHEFDYGVEAFAEMLENAVNPPQILCANIRFSNAGDSYTLKNALDNTGCLPYMIREIGGFRVGITGLMGSEAAGDIAYPGSVKFIKEKTALRRTVSEMKNKGCEFTIVLSHGGMKETSENPEDLQLAESVDGVDVIISSHSHTVLKRPVVKNDTVICSCGANCVYLGLLDINMIDGSVLRYELIPVDDKFEESPEINTKIDEYKKKVQSEFLDGYGLKFDSILCSSDICLDDLHDGSCHFGNYSIADLVTDAYAHAAGEAGLGSNVIAIDASGIIRDSIYAGDVTLMDAYNVVPLGRSSDGSIGYPLIYTKLSGRELRELCEIDASLGRRREDSQLFFSGLRYTYSDKRAVMNRVIDVFTKDEKGAWKAVSDSDYYTAVCNQYMAVMMPQITSMNRGFLTIDIKDKDGNKVSDPDSLLLRDKHGKIVKEWTAFVDYLLSFKGKLPGAYAAPRPCKIEEKNLTPRTYLKNPSKFGKVLYGAGIAAAGALTLAGAAILSSANNRRK